MVNWKKAFIDNIHFINQFTYIDEIAIEIGLNKEGFGLFGNINSPASCDITSVVRTQSPKTGWYSDATPMCTRPPHSDAQ